MSSIFPTGKNLGNPLDRRPNLIELCPPLQGYGLRSHPPRNIDPRPEPILPHFAKCCQWGNRVEISTGKRVLKCQMSSQKRFFRTRRTPQMPLLATRSCFIEIIFEKKIATFCLNIKLQKVKMAKPKRLSRCGKFFFSKSKRCLP